MQRRHIVYLRVSTDKQEVESQKTALSARIATYQNPVEWIEDVYTGTKADREGYQRMLHAVNAGWVIDITCWRADRIGRNALENLKLAQACEARSTDIIGHSDGMRLLSPNGKMIFTILSAIAEYEASKISENTKAGMIAAKAAGKVIGGGVPGYCKSHVLEVVDEIKLMLSNGYSKLKISKKLRLNYKTVCRTIKMIADGKPLLTRADMLAQVPVERRGKAHQRGLGLID